MTIEEILKARQNANGLNKHMRMHVKSLTNQQAVVEVTLTPELLNPLGRAHGGTIFTLCDIAAGTAAAGSGRIAVTLGSDIHFYKAGEAGRTLTAVAECRKTGKTTAVFFVTVTNDAGLRIADATFTMFYTGQLLEALQ